jgi:cyanophycin synthetase
VVKPAADTGGGQGVTTGVKTRRQLVQAAAAAAVYGRKLLIESQIEGSSYRLLYLDGDLLDAVVQSPPSVVGDGVASVRSLVKRANAERIAKGAGLGQKLIAVDPEMKNTLAEQGLKLSGVPAHGRIVRLKTAINDNGARDNRSAADRLCQSIIADGALAARTIGARLAGVDVVTPDGSVPLTESGGAIIEVNTTPGLYWHYHKRDGSTPVALPILERLFEDAGGRTLGPSMANVAAESYSPPPLPWRA